MVTTIPYRPDVPVASQRVELHRHDTGTGRWVGAVADRDPLGFGRIRIEVGTTGNRLDRRRRVRITGHDLVRAGGRLELRSWWPVREVRTNRIGQFAADLRGELGAAGSEDPDGDLAELARATTDNLGLDDIAGTEEIPDDLTGRTLRSAYPLLARPIELGARPEEVPVAAESLLRHPDARAAARATLGPRVTRPLVRALANALLPDERGRIVWEPVLCALMAARRCGPEQITAVLQTSVHRPGAASFSIGEIDRAWAMFTEIHPRRVSETLQAALADPDGTAELARRLAAWDSRPAPPPPHPAPAPAPARDPRPVAPRRHPGDDPIEYPATWIAATRHTVAGHTVVLPATPNELVTWGIRMENCLGAYRHNVATGRTRIMGFADGGRLQMAAEISGGRVLRQLERRGNSRPDPATTAAVVAFLRANHLIDADARRT